jgi:hypothetical protein
VITEVAAETLICLPVETIFPATVEQLSLGLYFERAVEVARRQEAKSWELRAAMSDRK